MTSKKKIRPAVMKNDLGLEHMQSKSLNLKKFAIMTFLAQLGNMVIGNKKPRSF